MGDLPPSFTEDDVRNLVEDHGGEVATVRMGLDKFGALVHMETKESQGDQGVGQDGVEGKRDLCQVEG